MKHKILKILPVLLLLLFSALVVNASTLNVHFIDIGQGDSILFHLDDHAMLVDAGTRSEGTKVLSYLRRLGINNLDIVIGTHPHADHIGGLIQVIQQISIGKVIDPAVPHTTRTFEDYLTAIDRKNIRFVEGRAGQEYELGEMKIKLLHPTSPSTDHLNNASIVAKVRYGDVIFLMTGDAEREAEAEILRRYAKEGLQSQILKVGHHGSRTSSTRAFLQAVSPEVAIIMRGLDNRYGHPHPETMRSLHAEGVKVYRTDLHGTVIVSTDGRTYDVSVERTADVRAPPKEEEIEVRKININTASAAELQRLHGIGPAISQRIVDYRNRQGPFSSIEEIKKIRGIGDSTFNNIKNEITVKD